VEKGMKKKGCLGCLGFLLSFGIIFLMALVFLVTRDGGTDKLMSKLVEKRLTEYQPLVESELEKYGLKDYTPLLLGIMYQESNGRGNDPMQSSESNGLSRNEIEEPEQSIEQGVAHFYDMYSYAQKKGVDLDTVIQSYNMGPGYIDYVASNGQKHTEELAKEFSKIQVEKNPDVYKCGGDKNNFRYPYCYGDYTYSEKVNERTLTVKEWIGNSATADANQS
jgi:hypothetical protein